VTAPPSVHTDVLVVGAGPAGSAAAAWAARAGHDVVLVDAAVFPRDKTCGDGLTPRAVAELERLGLGDWLRSHTVNHGLRAHGFGQTLLLPWPGGSLPAHGSAVARTELDDHLRSTALKAGATGIDGARAVDVRRDGDRVAAVVLESDGERFEIGCRRLVVADGVRSPLGKALGRQWHRDTVYGVAARSYVDSAMHDDPWISSHLELRDADGAVLSGYGWIFPLGDGQVNLGVGTLATEKRPAGLALRPLMQRYADLRREDFGLSGPLRAPTSALLPMGGAVSNVAGRNWALVGDAAACVNPLNGEGIDYGLETGRLLAEMVSAERADRLDLGRAWPALLRAHYGEAFSIARRLAMVATNPRVVAALGPGGMRSDWLMTLALRWMGNLVTDDDRDRAARVWRWAGRRSVRFDARPPFS
jgi:geranylgeranyl reductase family protein